MKSTPASPPLHWEANDIERKLGFAGAKYTGTNAFLTFGLGIIGAIAFYVALVPFTNYHFAEMFFERGAIPYFIVGLSGWSLAILFVKWRKLVLQKLALRHSIVPDEPDFVLSPNTTDDIIRRLYELASNPKQFLLLNRIERSVSNLKNIGRVADVDDIMRSQAENDENYIDSTYTLIRGFIWAIPVLGFIGTVLGLSAAIGGFGSVLSSGGEIQQLRSALQGVTGGLAIAFETTLIGLVAAVVIQLILTVVRNQEDRFLDECSEYCHRHIISKLRTIPVEENLEVEGTTP